MLGQRSPDSRHVVVGYVLKALMVAFSVGRVVVMIRGKVRGCTE